MSDATPPRVSFAIPVFDEEALIPELLRRVTGVLDETPGGPHQIVIVDDGSRDRSLEILAEAAAAEPRLEVISLSRNFGHQAALTAALDAADGDWVLVMDGDLQDAPELLPRFLERAAEGYDVVYARRAGRDEPWWLRACYFSFYRLISWLSDQPLPLDSGDFALLSRRVVEAMGRTPERHRYLRGLRAWVGFRQTELAVDREPRRAGASKYSPARLLRLAFDGIFAFSVVPLRAAAVLGLLAMLLSSAYGVFALVAKIVFDASPRGFTTLVLVIVFLAGVQMLFLGVVGEYVGRIYQEVKRRPHYLVREVIGGSRQGDGHRTEAPRPGDPGS